MAFTKQYWLGTDGLLCSSFVGVQCCIAAPGAAGTVAGELRGAKAMSSCWSAVCSTESPEVLGFF